jgi:hypothetical protein
MVQIYRPVVSTSIQDLFQLGNLLVRLLNDCADPPKPVVAQSDYVAATRDLTCCSLSIVSIRSVSCRHTRIETVVGMPLIVGNEATSLGSLSSMLYAIENPAPHSPGLQDNVPATGYAMSQRRTGSLSSAPSTRQRSTLDCNHVAGSRVRSAARHGYNQARRRPVHTQGSLTAGRRAGAPGSADRRRQ